MTALLLQALLLMPTFQGKAATAPPPADPSVVLDRAAKECSGGWTTAACKALKLQVEQVMLDSIVGLRAAGQKVDAKIYRVAARAETAQQQTHAARQLVRELCRQRAQILVRHDDERVQRPQVRERSRLRAVAERLEDSVHSRQVLEVRVETVHK